MENLGNDAFCVGVAVGIDIYRKKVIEAHERGRALLIDGELYYLETGRERLERTINDICR